MNYDTIILGSALYAGNIKGINLIINNYEKIKSKKLVLFICGAANYKNIETINNVNQKLQKIIPKKIFENIKIYHLRGEMDYKKMSIIHRMMMATYRKMIMLKGINNINEEEKGILKTYGKTTNNMSKENINEIVEYCR